MNTIDLNVLRKIAELSKLKYNDDELLIIEKDMSKILDYVKQVSDVKKEEVLIKTEVDAKTELREDEIKQSLPQNKVVFNSEGNDGTAFIIPQVLENE